MSNVLNNILSCGYLREYEHHNKTHVPDDVQQIIIKYSKQYAIYGIGSDHPLEAMNQLIGDPSDIFTNQYGINIKSRSNKLYIMNNNSFNNRHTTPSIPTSLSIKTTSHGTSNNTNLFIYTSNNLLFNTKIYSDQTINTSTFNQINTQFLYMNNIHDTIVDIQCGINHTLMLTKSGRVYSMGSNVMGLCGFNVDKYKHISQPKLLMENIISIAVGAFHNLLLNNKYQLYVCGYNYVGQLGITQNDINTEHMHLEMDDNYVSDSPDSPDINIMYDDDSINIDYDNNWSYVDINNTFEMVDTSDSDDDDDCYFKKHDKYGNETLLFIDKPIINKYFHDLNIEINKIFAGKFHSLCIDNAGIIYTFGQNTLGNLGNGEITEFEYSNPIPQKIILNDIIIDANCGENHNILLTNKNDIICFGDNSNNQCSIINKHKIINKPFMIEKDKELGMDNNIVIEKVICLQNKSLIFVDPYNK